MLVRQLDFDQQHSLDTWKGFYMFRNLFVVHFRYGENLLVRLKPYLIVLAVLLLSPVRGGRAEAAQRDPRHPVRPDDATRAGGRPRPVTRLAAAPTLSGDPLCP